MSIWRDKVGKIFTEVGNEFDIDPSKVRELFEAYFTYAAEVIKTGGMSDVNIFGLGTFTPDSRELIAIRKRCDKGYTTNCDYCDKMADAYLRIKDEKIKRKKNKKDGEG